MTHYSWNKDPPGIDRWEGNPVMLPSVEAWPDFIISKVVVSVQTEGPPYCSIWKKVAGRSVLVLAMKPQP